MQRNDAILLNNLHLTKFCYLFQNCNFKSLSTTTATATGTAAATAAATVAATAAATATAETNMVL